MLADGTKFAADAPKSALGKVRTDATPTAEALLSPAQAVARTWLLAFVAGGLLLRLMRYLLAYPLWGDECFLAANFIDRSFGELLQPLDYSAVAPLLLLWGERAMVLCCGFSEWSLRLIPLVASMTALVLFAYLARQLLAGWAAVLAVALLAVSYYPIRHGNEVKPYAVDLCMAVACWVLAAAWLRQTDQSRWLWAWVAWVPLALGSSYTAAFMAGGSWLVLVAVAMRRQLRGALIPLLCGALVLLASFALLQWVVQRGQYQQYAVAGLRDCWAEDFPPLNQPSRLPLWLLERHTGHMFSYPVGGKRGGSTLTALCVLAGGWTLYRRRQHDVLLLAGLPLALCFVASALGRYPYGGSQRTMQFLAPAVCLLAAVGVEALAGCLQQPARQRRVLLGVLGVLAALGVGEFVFDLAHPYKTAADLRAREFARWFWTEQTRNGLAVCVRTDLGVTFDPRHWQYHRTANYLCYRAQFQPGVAGTAVALDELAQQVTADRPLRCVLYNEHPQADPKFQGWLADMGSRFQLADCRQYLVNQGTFVKGCCYEDSYWVYEFVPRGTAFTAEQTSPNRPRRF